MKTSQKLSIYLVDDDTVFATALTGHLEKTPNVSVRSFETGEHFLENIDGTPDIVILDYYLNGTFPAAMNGLQVLKKLMKVHPKVKVIMLSVQDKMEVAVETIKHGAYDYVIKDDKVFLRAKHVIGNAARSVNDFKELKNYKFWSRMIVGVLLTMILIGVIVEINFPQFAY